MTSPVMVSGVRAPRHGVGHAVVVGAGVGVVFEVVGIEGADGEGAGVPVEVGVAEAHGHQLLEGGAVQGWALRPLLPGQVQLGCVQPVVVPCLVRWASFQFEGVCSSWGWVETGWTWSMLPASGATSWWQSQQVLPSRRRR
jgi:hypothetical protein